MSENKHAKIRFKTLDKCFRNTGRLYTEEDLIIECGNALSEYKGKSVSIQRTTLYKDIRDMKSEYGENIEFDEELPRVLRPNKDKTKFTSRKVFRYKDTSFSISNQPLNETEANLLREALLTLGRFKGLPQYTWINELSARLGSAFSLKQENNIIISFEQNEDLKGLELIPELYNAILYKKVLIIEYKDFKTEIPTNIVINPHFLKQFNMRWFLLGKSDQYETITNLALDRIECIKEADQTYIDSKIDYNAYFNDIIGVTKLKANIEHIILEVDKSLLPYLETKIIHISQIIVEKEDKYNIHLDLIPNYELETLILSFGEKVKVLEPQSLVAKLKERIHKLNNYY